MDHPRFARALRAAKFPDGAKPDLSAMRYRAIQFLGESVTVHGASPTLSFIVGHFGILLVLVFVADASITTWRRGERRKAVVGGSVVFFLLFGLFISCR